MNTRLMTCAVKALPLALLLGGAAPRKDDLAVLSPEQYGELAKVLDGREAGKPVRCIPMRGQSSLRAISNDLLVYRDGRRIYATRVLGKCSGLTSGGALITRPTNGQICRGDIARVADLSAAGIGITGACAMGDFIPYQKPKKVREVR